MNIDVSQTLGIKRDKKIEFYLLKNIRAFSNYKNRIKNEKEKNEMFRRLKENNRSFIDYYYKRNINAGFKGLDLIACRILVIYFLENGYEAIEDEINKIEDQFSRVYLRNRIKNIISQNRAVV